MSRTRNRRRRKRVSLAQMAREIGPRARRALRHARVALWRFKRSPAQQDRASMIATFAFIGVFGLGSVDAIITGGADFGIASTAYASEMPGVTRLVRPETAAPPPADEASEAAAPAKAVEDENIDYSFTTEELLGGPLLTTGDETSTGALVVETDKLLEVPEPAPVAATDDSTTL